jgi:hypothetical protein
MRKLHSFLLAAMMLAAGNSFTACGGSDDDNEGKAVVESAFKSIADTAIIRSMTWISTKYLHQLGISNQGGSVFRPIRRINLYISIYDNPGVGNWDGEYKLSGVEASMGWGTETWLNATKDADGLVKGGRITLTPTGKTDGGVKQYNMTLHIDELTDAEGNYARDINLSGTDYIGTMLTY